MSAVEQFHVSPDEWSQLQAMAAKALGFALDGDAGQATEPTHNVLFSWDYSRTAELLTLGEPNVGGITGHFVTGKVKDAVNGALAQIRRPVLDRCGAVSVQPKPIPSFD